MPTLRFRFPGGRYHATPWGHHVNEGQIEWPPSPWRILRALVACGFNTQRWTEIPGIAAGLFEKLAGTLPFYRLPSANAAHTRHYMPLGVVEEGREKTTLVFDTWAGVGDAMLDVHWPCELSEKEQGMLRRLTEHLGYLGRSESWVDAILLMDASASTENFDAFPHAQGVHPGPDWEQVSLMAAIPPQEYAKWRSDTIERLLGDLPLKQGKSRPSARSVKERDKRTAPYPERLVDCLLKDTVWWKQYRWSQPPGSQRVIYWRRTDSLEVSPPRQDAPSVAPRVTTMLLALTTPSGNRSALPPLNRTLPQAELFHRAIIGRLANGNRVDCPELTGRDGKGRPLRHRHLHAHILPLDLDADGHLDHIMIYAPMGLGEAAQHAIRTLRRTWTKGGVGDLQLALAGSGALEALRALPAPLDSRVGALLGPPAGAVVWVSATPFVPPRFLKSRGVNTLAGQVNAELASRQFPQAEQVEVLEGTTQAAALRHFVRRRHYGGAPPPVDMGYAIRVKFSEPIHGPLALGYASHFGLGLFLAEQPAL